MLRYLTSTVPVFAARLTATHPTLAGAWNPATRSWDIPAGACRSLASGPAPRGQTIMLDMDLHGNAIAQVTVNGAARNMENLASIDAATGMCTFGVTQAGVNIDFGDAARNYLWSVAPQFLGETDKGDIAPGGRIIF